MNKKRQAQKIKNYHNHHDHDHEDHDQCDYEEIVDIMLKKSNVSEDDSDSS